MTMCRSVRTRKNVIEIAEEAVPFLEKMEAHQCVIELPQRPDVETEGTHISLKRSDNGSWDVKIKYISPEGMTLMDWKWTARLIPVTKYDVEI